jgi:hypothetical protein
MRRRLAMLAAECSLEASTPRNQLAAEQRPQIDVPLASWRELHFKRANEEKRGPQANLPIPGALVEK